MPLSVLLPCVVVVISFHVDRWFSVLYWLFGKAWLCYACLFLFLGLISTYLVNVQGWWAVPGQGTVSSLVARIGSDFRMPSGVCAWLVEVPSFALAAKGSICKTDAVELHGFRMVCGWFGAVCWLLLVSRVFWVRVCSICSCFPVTVWACSRPSLQISLILYIFCRLCRLHFFTVNPHRPPVRGFTSCRISTYRISGQQVYRYTLKCFCLRFLVSEVVSDA